MNRMQFGLALAVMATMSLAGSFAAVMMLNSGAPLQAQPADGEAAKPGKITGTEFNLVDAKGNSRAVLDFDEGGDARFTLLDAAGKARVQLNSGGDRSYMALLDQNGVVRYTVAQDKDNSVLQTFLDSKGRNRMVNSLTNDSDTLFGMLTDKGESAMTLMAGSKQASTLILADQTGKNVATLFAKGDQTSLSLTCGDGQLLNAVLGDGRPVFALSKAEKLRLRALLDIEGEPELMFLNDKRESTWRAGQ